ncbi:MAG: hypothetical protein QOH49_3764 [Acidobacteriota bacterium]|jgi:hypothetical protein|nr:hypothetical protein [Acidobacteriota bacterium]
MSKQLLRRLSNVNRSLACCVLALLFAAACASSARAQGSPPVLKRQGAEQQQQATRNSQASDKDDDDNDEVFAPPAAADPATVLRKARFIFVHSDSVFISGSEVEDSLRKRKEFQAWGMVITRNEAQADLIIEITRKTLTRRFTFSVLDPRTSEVVTSGKTRSVLFGKKIANKIAEKFANRVKVYRPYH